MKLFEQRTLGGKVLREFWRPENEYGDRPQNYIGGFGPAFLYGPSGDRWGKLEVGEEAPFVGQTILVRVE
jgi:hypothetical protein